MLFSVIFGILAGILAGLFPGIHTNLIAVLVAGAHADAWQASVFLVAVAVSRSVIDAVPAVFLGAADAQNVMALLPGHKLLMKGCGVEAVKFCVLGSVAGMSIGLMFVPLFLFIFPRIFELLHPYLFWIILLLVLFLLMRDWYLLGLLIVTCGGVVATSSDNHYAVSATLSFSKIVKNYRTMFPSFLCFL